MIALEKRIAMLERRADPATFSILEYDQTPTPGQLVQIDAAEKQGQRLFVRERIDRLAGWLTGCGLPPPWAE